MKSSFEMTIRSEDELVKAAHELIRYAGEVKIWAFFGEMGAGKTTFIRSICRELRVIDHVSSPTFSVINQYSSSSGNSVYHFDFYRLESEAEALNIGCEEYFHSGSICLIEWPEKILNLLPHPLVKILFRQEKDSRLITFSYD